MTVKKHRIVALTGAGISAESGLRTFRGSDGLWEGERVEDVATPEAWMRDQERVLRFYNDRRMAARLARPNDGHFQLAALERWFDVEVITQNVDDLHERAGSSRVCHLHGSLFQSRSTHEPYEVYSIKGDALNLGDCCPLGHQLRPNIVWFGEPVPMMRDADRMTRKADAFLVVGTSLLVYPAAGLLWSVRHGVPVFVVDPGEVETDGVDNVTFIRQPASVGMESVKALLFGHFKITTDAT